MPGFAEIREEFGCYSKSNEKPSKDFNGEGCDLIYILKTGWTVEGKSGEAGNR